MLLAFDVGNTNIVMGVFKGKTLIESYRFETDKNKSADEFGMLIHQLFGYSGLNMKEVQDIIISTVVPSISYTLQHLSIKYFDRRAIVVGPGTRTGMIIKCDNPKQVGADRIVNAVAAYSKYGGPLVIIDMGTATTFCAVSGKGEYLGGSIAPGIKISSDALFEKTAKLPRVELLDPGHAICKNTVESMQAGLIYGHIGMVDYITEKMKNELEACLKCDRDKIQVVATGGLAEMMETGSRTIDHVDRLLTLEGLSIIYEKNRNYHHNGKHHHIDTDTIVLQSEEA